MKQRIFGWGDASFKRLFFDWMTRRRAQVIFTAAIRTMDPTGTAVEQISFNKKKSTIMNYFVRDGNIIRNFAHRRVEGTHVTKLAISW